MAIYEKFEMPFNSKFRDVRPTSQRLVETLSSTQTISYVFFGIAFALIFLPYTGSRFILAWVDVLAVIAIIYTRWFNSKPAMLPFKLPAFANMKDKRNPVPGKDGV